MEKTAAAIYLAGQGSMVRPHLIELQYRRIERYRDAMRDHLDTRVLPRDVFVDLQLPKFGMGSFDIEDVPAFARLRDAILAKRYAFVFIDLDESGLGRTPDHESDFVRRLFTAAGAKVFNAFTDDGNTFQKSLHTRCGPTAWADDVTDGADAVCFFPSLAGEIGEAIFRKELADQAESPCRSRISNRLNALKLLRPYSGGGKPFVENGLSLEWQRRKKE